MSVFFFKQKTAYELRISDWSSDVCSSDLNRICALPALWVGLLYDQGALDAAWDLVKGWSIEEQQALRDTVPRDGLCAPAPGGGTVGGLATQVLDIAAAGLAARGEVNSMGEDRKSTRLNSSH